MLKHVHRLQSRHAATYASVQGYFKIAYACGIPTKKTLHEELMVAFFVILRAWKSFPGATP